MERGVAVTLKIEIDWNAQSIHVSGVSEIGEIVSRGTRDIFRLTVGDACTVGAITCDGGVDFGPATTPRPPMSLTHAN